MDVYSEIIQQAAERVMRLTVHATRSNKLLDKTNSNHVKYTKLQCMLYNIRRQQVTMLARHSLKLSSVQANNIITKPT